MQSVQTGGCGVVGVAGGCGGGGGGVPGGCGGGGGGGGGVTGGCGGGGGGGGAALLPLPVASSSFFLRCLRPLVSSFLSMMLSLLLFFLGGEVWVGGWVGGGFLFLALFCSSSLL